MNNQIPIDKYQQKVTQTTFFEKYGKVCLEKDMAFDRIAELEMQVDALNSQISKMGKADADPPEFKKPEPGPILKPVPK